PGGSDRMRRELAQIIRQPAEVQCPVPRDQGGSMQWQWGQPTFTGPWTLGTGLRYTSPERKPSGRGWPGGRPEDGALAGAALAGAAAGFGALRCAAASASAMRAGPRNASRMMTALKIIGPIALDRSSVPAR